MNRALAKPGEADRAPSDEAGAPLLGQASWVTYEAAQGAFFVTLLIVVFAPFFATQIVADEARGQALWGFIQSGAGLLVALVSPFLGSIADASGPRKPGLATAMLIGSACMALLWFAEPGADHAILISAVLIITGAVTMEVASVYHNALLPGIVRPHQIGFVSGAGYAMSYVGSLATLVVWLVFISWPDGATLGLDPARFEVERAIGPLCAIWTVMLALPILLFTPDQPRRGLPLRQAVQQGCGNLVATFRQLRQYKNIAFYLLARTIYYDGLLVTMAFVGIYAGNTFGWDVETITGYGAAILLLSAMTGLLGGWIDDLIGSKATIQGAVAFFTVGFTLSLGTTPEMIYFVPYEAPPGNDLLPLVGGFLASLGFESRPEQVFVLTGSSIGLFAGPALASSRTMLARLAPRDMAAQFFGLYTLTGKATAFSAPFFIGVITTATGNARLGLSVILVYLVVGWIGMWFVRQERAPSLNMEDAS